MSVTPATETSPPSKRLAHIDRWLEVAVFAGAVLSIPAAAQPGELSGWILVVDIVAWLIFVVEAVVKISVYGRSAYLRDRWSWLDIAIIVLSAPYHLATGFALLTRLGSLARLARLVRVALVITKAIRQGRSLASRSNVPAAIGIVILATMSIAALVFVIEGRRPESAFDTFGDALWWSVVTLTTVGYGDLSPTTTGGRIGAVVLMLVGVAFLGTLAAALASLFVQDDEREEASEISELRGDVADLKRAVEELSAKLDR